ncbi:MAG TPA: DivIVA domain-containing protein [Solirubrobacteraceae bacterium]|nr:DivIVA domain-containing protein [Solirubrobacteraceae bacterium]
MASGPDPRESQSSGERRGRSSEPAKPAAFGSLLSDVPTDIRDVSFATVVRGYDRREVDAYVERVNRVIAELEISRSPQAAVKHALDRVGEQTSGVLQRAREVAEELTSTALAEAEHATRLANVEAEGTIENARMQAHQLRGQSKEEAEEIVARARAEAAESLKRSEEQVRTLQDGAEARLRALQADIQASADARRKVLDELRLTAAELDEFASGAINRFHGVETHDTQPEPPTETIPPRTEPRPSHGDKGDLATRTRIKPRKPADGATPNAANAGAGKDPSERASASRRKG